MTAMGVSKFRADRACIGTSSIAALLQPINKLATCPRGLPPQLSLWILCQGTGDSPAEPKYPSPTPLPSLCLIPTLSIPRGDQPRPYPPQ